LGLAIEVETPFFTSILFSQMWATVKEKGPVCKHKEVLRHFILFFKKERFFIENCSFS
jgi:hypothetical protein